VLTRYVMYQFNRSIHAICCHHRITTLVIYKMRPLSNLQPDNFISLLTENYLCNAATATNVLIRVSPRNYNGSKVTINE